MDRGKLACALGALAVVSCASSKPVEKPSAPRPTATAAVPALVSPESRAISPPGPATAEAKPRADVASERESAPAVATADKAEVHQCDGGKKLTVHFYDVGQALSVLVELPDGKHVLIDTGDSRNPAGIEKMLAGLKGDLNGAPIDVLWITHQHSDHIGGAVKVLDQFEVLHYVDNGTGGKPSNTSQQIAAEVVKTRAKAKAKQVPIAFVDLTHRNSPLPESKLYSIVPFLPSAWGANCRAEPNDCSIGLRVDFCQSSVLFTGDAEGPEEANLHGSRVTLLQIGHHGSPTSTHEPFLEELHPSYAVISAGLPNVGTNTTYCHPAEDTIKRVSALLGDVDANRTIEGFYGPTCKSPSAKKQWHQVPASKRLWATEVDGDILLETNGDGIFARVHAPNAAAVPPGRPSRFGSAVGLIRSGLDTRIGP